MNIYILDNNISKIAEYYCDQHIWSGLNEIPIMLSCAFTQHELTQGPTCNTFREVSKEVHYHEWSKWCRTNHANFNWAVNLWKKLEFQSILRFNVGRHRYWPFIKWCNPKLEDGELAPFPLCFHMRSEARQLRDNGISDTIELYRHYYSEKIFARWTNNKPNWL